MSTIDSIEKEIAELEERRKSDQAELHRLKKAKLKMLKQSEIEQKLSDQKTIDELIESANKSANKHSV